MSLMNVSPECPPEYRGKILVITNADHIRSMTDEELAEFLCGVYDEEYCENSKYDGAKFICGYVIPDFDENKICDWLKQPYKEET